MDQIRTDIRKLMITVNQIDGLYYLAARALGTKYNTFALLYALSDGNAYSQKQICAEWLIPRTTINTVVKECVDAGYVTLTAIGNKEKLVALTEAGEVYAHELLKRVMDAERIAMEKTVEAFSEDFVHALEYFTRILNLELGEGEEYLAETNTAGE